MTDGNEQALKGEQTLKSLLEFLSKLEESEEVRKKVIEEIEDKVKHYITNKLTDFATEDGSSGFLPKTISKSSELRTNIVKSDKVQNSTQSFDDDNFNETDYAKHLIDNIFPFFGCLYYMYYECATQCNSIEGGDWWQEKCDGSDGGQKKHLNKWLTTNSGAGRMIQRGFKHDELSQETANELFPTSGSDALLHYREGAQLQDCLFFMLFLPNQDEWNHAQSGYAVLFLETFCQNVKDGKFQDKYNDNDKKFKSACKHVTEKISTLTGLSIIAPVAQSLMLQYKDHLQPEHFWQYIEWLKDNLKNLITSLRDMAMDVSNWARESLKTSSTFGPYPWGFTFAYNWENNIVSKRSALIQQLQQLTDALESLQRAMDKIEHVSYGATIGKVIGGLGAAGAAAAGGAAYSGVLGPVAESIGKFVRGLFF